MNDTTIDQEFSAAAKQVFAGKPAPAENPLFNLGVDLMSEFAEAEMMRQETEQRWLNDLRQYKGIYEPKEEANMRGSKAFLRKTRVKVEAVDARMMDLLFPANRERNYEVAPTPSPMVAPEIEDRITKLLTDLGGGKAPDDKARAEAIRQHVDAAAKKMGVRIDDQLTEAKYRNTSREVLHSGHLYGTGILKGPLVERRTRISYVWSAEKNNFVQQVTSFSAPFMTHVPVWRWYPDMTVTEQKDCRYNWEHHRLGRAEMAELASRQTFDGQAIKSYLESHPQGNIKLMRYEQELRAIKDDSTSYLIKNTGQFDVFERWGWLAGDKLRAAGAEVPDDRLHEAFFSNIWMLPDGQVIKAILAPIEGVQWPYHLYYLEKDETSIFGDGYPAIMRDDQKMINAAGRMLIDNAAITSGPQFEVFLPAFPTGADISNIYPGKIWPRVGGDMQYPAVRELNFNAHIGELVSILQLFDANADDTTAVPKYTYGDNPRGGAAATMGGLSMLMAQANIALKDQVTSFDEGITKPFIEAMYHWNMKFSSDNEIKGDFDVKAIGAASLVAKEVRSQAMGMFAATLQPEERGRIKWGDLTRQKAEAMDISDVVMTDEEYESQQGGQEAEMQKQIQQIAMKLEYERKRAEVAEMMSASAEREAKALGLRLDSIAKAVELAPTIAQQQPLSGLVDAILKNAGWSTPPAPGADGGAAEPGGMPPMPPDNQTMEAPQ